MRRPRRPRDPAAPWTERERTTFIARLAEGMSVVEAARLVGRTRTSALAERARDPLFAARWDSVLECAFEVLETRLLSRAIGGVAETMAPFGSGSGARAPDDTRLARWILSNLRERPWNARTSATTSASGAAGRAGAGRPIDPSPRGPEPVDPRAEQERIDRLIAEVAARIAEAEAARGRN